MSEKYKNLKVKELQELLQKHGIPHSGKKEELIERLVKHDEAQELANLEKEFGGDLDEFDESKLDLSDIKNIDDELTQDPLTTETISVPEVTTTTTETKEPVESTKPNSSFKFTPISFEKKAEETTKTTTTPPATVEAKTTSEATTTTKPTNDAEKALERAKRFGIQLNEKAKQDIRAQRFGIPTKTSSPKPNNNKNNKGIDPEVLKKRAERFGLNNNNNNSKKNSGAKVPVTLDPAEEEKKRKRAERFNNDPSKKQKAE